MKPLPDPFAGFEGGRAALLEAVRSQFRLDWVGPHGAAHWARVWANGRRLAAATGADLGVVELFAWLHDSCRHDDHRDPHHGPRAATWAHELRGSYFELDDERFELLTGACEEHTRGGVLAHATVMTCWDADRLDLGRVGIRPDPRYLCTDLAKDERTIRWALRRSLDDAPE